MAKEGIAHKLLTDPQLHEPKGASTALQGQVLFADGDGGTVWNMITPAKIHIENPTTIQGSSEMSTTDPVKLDTLGMSATTDGVCTDALNFTQVNKNLKEVAVLLNQVIDYVKALKSSHNALVVNEDSLLEALVALGFVLKG